MQKIFTRSIPNHEASRKLAAELCDTYLRPAGHFTLFLEGGLGAGKTFLVKEMLQILGVNEAINSPTYALVNEYAVDSSPEKGRLGGVSLQKQANPLDPSAPGEIKKFAHFDFYRLEDKNDFFARGFQDMAGEAGTSHFVEWPEQLSPEAKGSFGGQLFVLKIDFGIGAGMRRVKLLQQ